MKNQKYILVVLLFTLLFVGCKSSKRIITQSEKESIEVNRQFSPADMVVQLQKNQPAYETAKVNKMSINLRLKDREMEVKAICSIVSDSAMHISIQPFFGIELFKVEMTPSSLLIIDKANRKFYESSYGIFDNQFGIYVSYDVIQSLISNRLFVAGKRGFSPNDFSWSKDARETKNSLLVWFDKMNQEVKIDLGLGRISNVMLKSNDEGYQMETLYSNFRNFNGTVFPSSIDISAVGHNQVYAFHFMIEDAVFDVPVVMQSTNLSKYSRGDINSFFKK